MWFSLTGSVVPVGQLYDGAMKPGDRAATAAEAAAWQAAQAVVPATVAMWQAKAALQSAGLLTAAANAVTAAGNPALTAFWPGAASIDRTSPTLAAIAATLGLTSAQIDALFVAAGGISL